MRTLSDYRMRIVTCAVALFGFAMTTQAQSNGNAALLYYQACLLYEKPDETTQDLLSEFSNWEISAGTAIREHVEKNRRIINYVVTAANMPQCDWGYDYSQGLDLALPNLLANKRLTFLVLADARFLAEQGDYQTAIDRCLTIHKAAFHIADRPLITYLIGMSMSGRANRAIQEILPIVPEGTGKLTRLKTQLSQFQAAFPSVANAITQEGEVSAATMRKEEAQTLLRMIGADGDSTGGGRIGLMADRIRQGDAAFFEKNRQHFLNSIATITTTLESALPYQQMYTMLDELGKHIGEEYKDNPDATLTSMALPAAHRVYILATRLHTHFNAVATAIDLYTIKSRTGRLPDALPTRSPLDLFSGKPFEYEKTPDGFILRCRVKESPEKAKVDEYAFKVRP